MLYVDMLREMTMLVSARRGKFSPGEAGAGARLDKEASPHETRRQGRREEDFRLDCFDRDDGDALFTLDLAELQFEA